MHVGTVTKIRVHVEGVPTGQKPTVHFEVSGAARLRDGAPRADAPVKNGIAEVTIQGVTAGQLVVRYQVQMPMLDQQGGY